MQSPIQAQKQVPKAAPVPNQVAHTELQQPSQLDDSAAKKTPKKSKISAGKIVAIVAVLIVIIGAISAAAYFLPDLLQDAKDSENNIDKTVDYTATVDSQQGYNIEKYNSDDILFEVEKYDEEDKLIGSVEYVFDDDGKEIGYNEYNKSGQLVDEIRY